MLEALMLDLSLSNERNLGHALGLQGFQCSMIKGDKLAACSNAGYGVGLGSELV